ncbi:MAG: hypothetical protein NT144_13820 [Bacteroidia bacterium]|nr:hypothetical protein [Bacteroidia bacterium]
MTNKEQIQRDIAIAFDFVEQIIDTPDILDKIPDGTSVTFLDSENVKPEKLISRSTAKKYIKVKRHFEVL